MKKISFLFFLLFITNNLIAQVRVRGYYRSNGTYVQPHYRSSPDGNPYNNWSYPGNTNPYTGKTATGNPETYLNNYYNRSSSTPSPAYSTGGNNYGSSSSNADSYSNPTSTYSSTSSSYSTPSTTYSTPTYSSTPNSRRLEGIPFHATLKVEPASPVHNSPSAGSPVLGTTANNVIFEQEINADYILVSFNGQTGYLNKTWVMVEETKKLLLGAKYTGLTGKKVKVFQYSPIYSAATVNSKLLDTADDRYVHILRDVNEEYFYVQYYQVTGYMLKKFVDL